MGGLSLERPPMSYSRSKAVIAALLIAGVALPASAAMTVGTFLARANALRDQGPMALMSPDFTTLKAEAKTATTQLKAERAARAAAGKPPIACVPEVEKIGIMDMLDGLAALPAADQKRPLKDGYAKVIAKHYPCR
jgi:hydrogenase maturation factor HypF (carbamoyltransferase family)